MKNAKKETCSYEHRLRHSRTDRPQFGKPTNQITNQPQDKRKLHYRLLDKRKRILQTSSPEGQISESVKTSSPVVCNQLHFENNPDNFQKKSHRERKTLLESEKMEY